ncbi:MAG: flagellar basal-body rod protein FlgF [Rhodospirillales bacterium]|nr:flagellar basal-body rod protein FlgF [Rhodospirillales bacterium]
MENSILVALSRQDALQRNMDIVANNIANMNTTAFKAERMMFREYLAKPLVDGHRTGDPVSFVSDVASVRDHSEGGFEETGNDLDVAISGDGFLAVQTPLGERYTRNGHLRLDANGQLVTDHGMPVLARGGTPVQIGVTDTKIGIARDGSISSENGSLGQLRVVHFDDPDQMQAVEAGLYSSDETPKDVAQPLVLQGMLENSNVQPIMEMTRMIGVQRAYDQARTLVDREDERIRNMLRTYAE